MSYTQNRPMIAQYMAETCPIAKGRLRDQIITTNMGLVKKEANRMIASGMLSRRGSDVDDAIQNGVCGMLIALEKYDPSRGEFSTYATIWIRKYIRKTGSDIVRNGKSVQFSQENIHDLVSEEPLKEPLDSKDISYYCNLYRERYQLSERSEQMIRMYFCEKTTFLAIGNKMGVTRQRVQATIGKFIKAMRKVMSEV